MMKTEDMSHITTIASIDVRHITITARRSQLTAQLTASDSGQKSQRSTPDGHGRPIYRMRFEFQKSKFRNTRRRVGGRR